MRSHAPDTSRAPDASPAPDRSHAPDGSDALDTPVATTAPDVLAAIVAGTRRSVEVRRAERPIAVLETAARERHPRGEWFEQRLRAGATEGTTDGATEVRPFNVIAECKRRSPSRGVLCPDYDPAGIARSYEEAGAAAISVLTEPTFFDGSLEHLQAVRRAVSVPLLRKDFIVDEYQLLEARAAGADAILLIVAALDDATLRALLNRAGDYGLAALVEVQTALELTRAQTAGAHLIGVNSRDLKTLSVSLGTLFDLRQRIDPSLTTVAESGIRTRADLEALRAAGYSAFLVGERFMTEPNPGAALARLMRE